MLVISERYSLQFENYRLNFPKNRKSFADLFNEIKKNCDFFFDFQES